MEFWTRANSLFEEDHGDLDNLFDTPDLPARQAGDGCWCPAGEGGHEHLDQVRTGLDDGGERVDDRRDHVHVALQGQKGCQMMRS